ncbi:MAG: hypothetical protein GF401_14470 [Chitinivibrionales bacterium]|nr:hypothetical protein [Chitinivibrionales bacterium]
MIRRALSLALAILVIAIGCSSSKQMVKPDMAAIDSYIKANPDLPELDKSCIYDGRFEVGMQKETVKFLLGEPKKIEIVHQPWATQENWVYTKGGKKVFIIEDDGVVGILQD